MDHRAGSWATRSWSIPRPLPAQEFPSQAVGPLLRLGRLNKGQYLGPLGDLADDLGPDGLSNLVLLPHRDRGSDVLKAIALGAKFVFVGRPFVYAAAIGGEAGVSHAIEILSTEISRNMGLLGINALGEMSSDRLIDLGRVNTSKA